MQQDNKSMFNIPDFSVSDTIVNQENPEKANEPENIYEHLISLGQNIVNAREKASENLAKD